MALVGKYTKYETVDTGETEIQTIEYPSAEIMGENHPHIHKAGTIEEFENQILELKTTVFENVYLTVHSLTTFKHFTNEGSVTLTNITYRIYESKDHRFENMEDVIHQDHLVSQKIDYSLGKNEMEQAYELVKTVQGCDELVKY